jgi:hypothetical protein
MEIIVMILMLRVALKTGINSLITPTVIVIQPKGIEAFALDLGLQGLIGTTSLFDASFATKMIRYWALILVDFDN